MVIRPLHPLDITRHRLFGGAGMSNRARTLDSLSREKHRRMSMLAATRLGLAPQAKGVCSLTMTDGGQIVGIAAARRRSGPRSWEVSQLLLAPDQDAGGLDLIKALGQSVADRGGERVFIKLQTDDPLVGMGTSRGLVPCAHELLFRGVRRSLAGTRSTTIRKKRPSDDHDLFRLYNASTPSQSRFLIGVTFDQWLSSLEQSRGRAREHVFEEGSQVRGWVRTVRRSGAGTLQIMVHPDSDASLSALMDFGLTEVAGAKKVFCLVQEHEVLMQRLLVQRSFEVVGEYATLVVTMTVPSRDEKTRHAVTVAPT